MSAAQSDFNIGSARRRKAVSYPASDAAVTQKCLRFLVLEHMKRRAAGKLRAFPVVHGWLSGRF